jgi:hypothetical protein
VSVREGSGPTPVPWHTSGTFDPDSARPTTWVWGPPAPGDQSGEIVAQEVTLSNAAFIARACNSHDALVEALRAGLEHQETYRLVLLGGQHSDMSMDEYRSQQRVIVQARAALASATEGQ